MSFEIMDVEDIAKDLESSAPEPSEQVIEQEGEGESEPGIPEATLPEGEGQGEPKEPGKFEGLVDKWGRPFDPRIHVTDENGNPVINRWKGKGYLRIKNGVRPPEGAMKSQVRIPKPPKAQEARAEAPEAPQDKEPPKPTIPPEMVGKIAADYTQTLGVALGGPEWYYVKDPDHGIDEALMMRDAYTAYFRAKGVTDIPPGWLVILALGQYAAPRLTMPETKKRMGKIRKGLKRLYYWIRGKRIVSDGARADIRDDRERQNDTSKTDMPNPAQQGVGNLSPGPY